MKKLLVLLLLMYPLSASAQTYEWVDQAGTVNFTEDLGKVPKKYRKKVRVIGGDESGAPQIIEGSEPVKGTPKDAAAQKDGGKEKKTTTVTKEDAALRADYDAAKATLQATEQDLADLRARLGDTSKMSRNEFLTIQNTVKQNENRVKDQKKKLEQLRDKADKTGVNLDQK
jgi:hypothetical protein